MAQRKKATTGGKKTWKKVTRYTYDDIKEPRTPETGHTPLLPADEQVVTLPMDNGWRKAIHFYTHEEGWKNKLICGDSLHVMESLLHYENLRGKVQMIYLDPPYGIAYSSNFQQRARSSTASAAPPSTSRRTRATSRPGTSTKTTTATASWTARCSSTSKKTPNIKAALRAEVDPDEFTLKLTSEPFPVRGYKRIAVKVVDVYGNESVVVRDLT